MFEIACDPVLVIAIFAACCALLFLVLGCFAHRRPRNACICWLDRNFAEVLTVSSLTILGAIVAVVASKPASIPKVPLTILSCCSIVWVLLAVFAASRHCRKSEKKHGDVSAAKLAASSVEIQTLGSANDVNAATQDLSEIESAL